MSSFIDVFSCFDEFKSSLDFVYIIAIKFSFIFIAFALIKVDKHILESITSP